MKAGTKARVIQPVVSGTVVERRFNADDQIEVLLEWTDPDGSYHQRWFLETALEEVPAQ